MLEQNFLAVATDRFGNSDETPAAAQLEGEAQEVEVQRSTPSALISRWSIATRGYLVPRHTQVTNTAWNGSRAYSTQRGIRV